MHTLTLFSVSLLCIHMLNHGSDSDDGYRYPDPADLNQITVDGDTKPLIEHVRLILDKNIREKSTFFYSKIVHYDPETQSIHKKPYKVSKATEDDVKKIESGNCLFLEEYEFCQMGCWYTEAHWIVLNTNSPEVHKKLLQEKRSTRQALIYQTYSKVKEANA